MRFKSYYLTILKHERQNTKQRKFKLFWGGKNECLTLSHNFDGCIIKEFKHKMCKSYEVIHR